VRHEPIQGYGYLKRWPSSPLFENGLLFTLAVSEIKERIPFRIQRIKENIQKKTSLKVVL
jgi:hypothetical protein